MKKQILLLIALIMSLGILASCIGHVHDWTEAECNFSSKCTICGEIRGDALGHSFVDGVCIRCSEREQNSNLVVSAEQEKYERAFTLIAKGKYDEAYAIFLELGDYADSATQLNYFKWLPKVYTITDEEYIDTYRFVFDHQTRTLKVINECVDEGDFYEENVEYAFDEKYNIISIAYNYDDGTSEIEKFEYDEYNNLVKYVFNDNIHEYIYDENGNVITYISGEEITEYSYDESGNLLSEIFMPDGKNIATSNKYEYDENNKVVKHIFNSYIGERITVYTYNELGLIIEERNISSDDGYLKTYTYDENGRLIKIERPGYVEDYVYDECGQLVRESINGDSGYIDIKEYFYDENGRKIEEHIVFTSHEWTSYFEYDERGSIIRIQTGLMVETIEYGFLYIPREFTDEMNEIFDIENYG